MRKFVSVGPALVVLLTVAITLMAGPSAVRQLSFASTSARVQLAQASLDQDDILERLNEAVRNIADAVEPTVVHIRIEVLRGRAGFQSMSQGSGWVFDEAGHIVTNAHVVRGADRVLVQFYDGRQVTAEVLGYDQTTDIAVLRVDPDVGLIASRRATGDRIQQGDRVFAFGSPFGFKFSMSEGIVSGLGRDPRAVLPGARGATYTNFIQTDAAVNPGNSGGPLVDVNGRVVGMNVAIATARDGNVDSGQSAGISFAIPLDTIEAVVGQLIEGRVVNKGFLGVSYADVDPRTGEDMNKAALKRLNLQRGVFINEVVPSGPAAEAGLAAGDVIIRINDALTPTPAVMRSVITNHQPGDAIDVTVVRDGEERTFQVVLGNLREATPGLVEAEQNLVGFGVMRVYQSRLGVAIDSVGRGSPADRMGLSRGDIITHVEGESVDSLEQMLAELSVRGFSNGRPVKITVLDATDSEPRELTIRSEQ